MKKSISIAMIMALPFLATAQSINLPESNMEIFRIITSIVTVALFMVFILIVMKRVLEYRLKNRIVDKGIPADIASSFLQTSAKEDKNINIKWFAILAGIGVALTGINYTQPLGIHSFAIMAFSIAASFLGYFFFLKQSEK